MARDRNLTLRDVQTILGHQHISTTADIYLVEDNDIVVHRALEHLADRERRICQQPPAVAVGYDEDDLSVLFGDDSQ